MDTIAGKKLYKELENLAKGTFFQVMDLSDKGWEYDHIEIIMHPGDFITNIFVDKQKRKKSDNFLDNVEKIVKKYKKYGFKMFFDSESVEGATFNGPDIDDYFCVLMIDDWPRYAIENYKNDLENEKDENNRRMILQEISRLQKSLNESDNSLMESFNGFAQEEDYISLNESLNLRPALNKIKNICARLQKEFGLECYATEDEVTFNNDDDIMSNLVVGKKYNSLKQYLVNVIQIMKLCGRKIMFNTQYDYNSILV